MKAAAAKFIELVRKYNNYLTDQEIFLGVSTKDIHSFFSNHEVYSDNRLSNKLMQIIRQGAINKIVINGNLDDTLLDGIIEFCARQKIRFSIVVMDGYREFMTEKKNLSVGLVLLKHGG